MAGRTRLTTLTAALATDLIVDFAGGSGDDVFAAIGRGTLDGGPGALTLGVAGLEHL